MNAIEIALALVIGSISGWNIQFSLILGPLQFAHYIFFRVRHT
jgi:hypothetical protein